MVLASNNLTYQPPPYSSITSDYDRNCSITLRLVIRRLVLTPFFFTAVSGKTRAFIIKILS
jgi:hypothetical protein